ncbi:MAG TPA: sulfatase [Thermoanaerobaculia bacterium]|nr:sulfatase [Thermoanaerobaculia bacterium]
MASTGPSRDSLAAWWPLQLRVGFGLGLGLGLLDVLTVNARDGKVPISVGLLGAVVSGVIYALLATLFALLAWPVLAMGLRRLGAAAWAAGLALMSFLNLLGLWVYWLTGVYPTLAPVLMLWASPSQFLHAGLQGQEWRVAVLLGTAVALGLLLYRLLRRAPPAPVPLLAYGLSSFAGAAGLFLLAVTQPSTETLLILKRATPELRWLTTVAAQRSVFQSMPYERLQPAPGAPLEAGAQWLAAARSERGPRPNVLLVMLESLPAHHLGHAGYPRPVSPHLDRLAAVGWRARNAWSAGSQSNYAQTAILSSQLPMRHRQLETYARIDYPRVLFHDLLADLGYQTAIISSQNENWQGMSRFLLTGKPVYFFHSLSHPGPHLGRGAERKLPDHLTVDHFFEWLERTEPGRPWAAYLNFQRTHFPYEMPPGFSGPYQPSDPTYETFNFLDYPEEEVPIVVNRYDNAVEYVDRQIGRILEHLEATERAESTLVVVVADHGELLGEGGAVTHGKNLAAGVLRVPLLLVWPGRLQPRVIETPVSTLDVLPTVLDLLELPPHPGFQGTSFRDPQVHAARRPAQFMALQSLQSLYGVVCEPWKLVIDWSSGEAKLRFLDGVPVAEDVDRVEDDNPEAHARLLSLVLSQRAAQLDYYTGEEGAPARRYAPGLLTCPELPQPRFFSQRRK